ncbi:MAG: hypothetical protein AB1710_10240 [Pseudomonadota bacterium]
MKYLLNRPQLIALPLACSLALGGCGKEEPKQAAQPKPAAQTAEQPAPQTAGQAPAAQPSAAAPAPVKGNEPLPAGHPPMDAAKAPAPADNKIINQQLAASHPKSEGKAKPAVVVPDSVKGQWSAVNLAITGQDGAEKQVRVPIGDKVAVGKDGAVLKVLTFLPSYTSDFKTITSSSNNTTNPAIQVQLVKGKEVLTEGWVFQNLPEFNSFVSSAVQVKLLSAEPAKGK